MEELFLHEEVRTIVFQTVVQWKIIAYEGYDRKKLFKIYQETDIVGVRKNPNVKKLGKTGKDLQRTVKFPTLEYIKPD